MIAQFALRLICGMSLMWAAAPRREITCGFFRIQMLVALGLSVLVALTAGIGDHAPPLMRGAVPAAAVALAVLSFGGSIAWTLQRRGAGGVFVFAIALCSAGVLIAARLSSLGTPAAETAEAASPLAVGLVVISELVSAALLGSAVTGMLLGHWYLTAPGMSLEPLSRLNRYLAIAAAARLALSAAALALAWSQIAGPTQFSWLGLRWLAGVFGPLIVAGMVWRILKYRNTQAATGVLFVGVILTFIGELSAVLLTMELGIPL